ncbi:MAG: BrnA antitoxin family protein [Desulfobacteraceae bacterium]|nr:BrnA antitoxin family protein [Desulfobacteraceae bacterium]
MKTAHSEKIVRVKGIPKLTEEQREELLKLAAMSDDDIDYSDIPEITDFSGFEVGKFYRPVKETVTVRLDADVLHWLKQGGKGYQSRLNAILRKEMASQPKMRKAA